MTTSGTRSRTPGSDDDRLFMRYLALGRLQAASHVRLDLDGVIRDAIRGAHRLGATLEEIRIESGLPDRTIRRVIKGGGL